MIKRNYNILLNSVSIKHLLFAISLILSLTASAKETTDSRINDSTTVSISKIYYPVNKVTIYENYMDNPVELEKIKRHLAESPRIDSITIYSYASPEGPYSWNKWLARERGKTAKRYILANIPEFRNFPDSLIKLDPTAENWAGMREEIVRLYDRYDKEQVLEIIDRPGITDEQRKQLLKEQSWGWSWKFILSRIMPQLRHATWIAVWCPIESKMSKFKPMDPISPIQPTAYPFNIDTPAIQIPKMELNFPPIIPEARDTVTILALKSNLLYDAVTWLNFSVEAPIGDNFSLLYYHQFPWWRWGESRNEFCNRFLSIGGEARWWFAPQPQPSTPKRKIRDRLVGHFLGVYGESGKWDFEHKREICYQGEHWSVGLSYGYSFPISRNLNLELSISGGYASIAYRGYTPSEDYSILWRDYNKIGRWHYFGPTKAQVSLVIPITVSYKKRYKE